MTSQEDLFKQLPVKLSGIQFLLSFVVIALSLLGVMLRFEELRTMCFCTLNYLAWSWIAFGINIFVALATFTIYLFNESKIIKYLFALQSLAFFTGLFLIAIFGVKLIDVI